MVIWNKGCTFLCNSNCSQAMENSKVFPIMQETPLDNQEGLHDFTFRKGHGLSLEMTIWTQHFQRTAFWAMKQSASRRSIPIRPLNPKNARWF